MADPKGFMTTPRELPTRRPVDVRIQDWREVYEPQSFEHLQKQAGRCMVAFDDAQRTRVHRQHRVGGAERRRQCELLGVEVDGDDPLRTRQASALHDVEADPADADHGDVPAGKVGVVVPPGRVERRPVEGGQPVDLGHVGAAELAGGRHEDVYLVGGAVGEGAAVGTADFRVVEEALGDENLPAGLAEELVGKQVRVLRAETGEDNLVTVGAAVGMAAAAKSKSAKAKGNESRIDPAVSALIASLKHPLKYSTHRKNC